MDNVLIAQSIAQSKEGKSEVLSKNPVGPSQLAHQLFLQYMETLRPDQKNYDVKLETQKYHVWSKNAQKTYH